MKKKKTKSNVKNENVKEYNVMMFFQPIFLHRNLSYMKDRMSRSHNKRKSFKVDSLLKAEKDSMPGNYMTLTFLGFYNKALPKEQPVDVKLVISKISHLKRKDNKAMRDVSLIVNYFFFDKGVHVEFFNASDFHAICLLFLFFSWAQL